MIMIWFPEPQDMKSSLYVVIQHLTLVRIVLIIRIFPLIPLSPIVNDVMADFATTTGKKNYHIG